MAGSIPSLTTPRATLAPLAFRVGVTGTRDLGCYGESALATIDAQVEAVLQDVGRHLQALAVQVAPAGAYLAAPDGVVRPQLRVVSPLAEGADRLVARVALDHGYRLEAPLPFEQAEYERDFQPGKRSDAENQASLDEFRTLLARAGECAEDGPRVLALDGGRGQDEAGSYGAVGRFVVRNCDLLIAVWNGEPGKGAGGTADTVRFAARSGPPVWWIDATGTAPPTLVLTHSELRHPSLRPGHDEAKQRLHHYLRGQVLPPGYHRPHRHGAFGRLARHWHSGLAAHNPLAAFLAERLPEDQPLLRWLWGIEGRTRRAMAAFGRRFEVSLGRPGSMARLVLRGPRRRRRTVPRPPTPEPAPPAAVLPGAAALRYWDMAYAMPDQLATAYAARYRSSYVLVALFASLAVMLADTGLAWPQVEHGTELGELLLLATVCGLVVVNLRRRWHERWISYRLVAELCRKQGILASLGWSLPSAEAARIGRGDHGPHAGDLLGGEPGRPGAWVGWYFNALTRAAPMPAGLLGGPALDATRANARATLIAGQVQYHRARRDVCRHASHGLAGLSEVLLALTLAGVAISLGLWALHAGHGWGKGFGIASAFFAALSAASVALRAYAELDVLADESDAMAAMLHATEQRLHRLPQGSPLMSQEVGAVVFDLATSMLAEEEGWARLFRVKAVEAG